MPNSATSPFDLFELPLSLKVDKKIILKKFYSLSKESHPDNFTLAEHRKQEEALQTTAAINQAKKILDDPSLRLEYLLKEKGWIQDDEKYALPMDFLSEMMELNEEKMEWSMNEDESMKTAWQRRVEEISKDLQEQVAEYFSAEDLAGMEVDWPRLKDYYFKKKYLNRMMGQ